jgi:hypothetical protein
MEGSKAIIANVTVRILRPLIRILLRFEVAHSEFSELAKRAYVDVAYRYFSIPKRKQTYSRAAVLTGLSRKEVVRLRELDERAEPPTRAPLNRATRVIGGWLRDAEFLDDQNQPKDIPLRGETGSFEALVARYSGDITARAILDELVRVGAVIYADRHTVHLAASGYIPEKSETQMLEVAGRAVTDLLRTSAHNIMDAQHAHFQRQVSFRNIPASVAEEFRRYSHDRCQDLMLEFNTWLSERSKTVELKPGESRMRVGVGLYYFENDNSEE